MENDGFWRTVWRLRSVDWICLDRERTRPWAPDCYILEIVQISLQFLILFERHYGRNAQAHPPSCPIFLPMPGTLPALLRTKSTFSFSFPISIIYFFHFKMFRFTRKRRYRRDLSLLVSLAWSHQQVLPRIASISVHVFFFLTLIWIHLISITQLRAVRELIAPVHNPWVA